MEEKNGLETELEELSRHSFALMGDHHMAMGRDVGINPIAAKMSMLISNTFEGKMPDNGTRGKMKTAVLQLANSCQTCDYAQTS
jgi:hypothetical protein